MNSQEEEIELFREYLRIPSVQPNVDYEPCIKFLEKQAANLELPVEVCYPGGPTKPCLIITWLGQKPEMPSIMLNSHMDVVPVFPEHWNYPPFGAEMDSEGRIFARGSQDMKSVGMQYLAAIRSLKRDGIKLKRTLHVTFMPDEEDCGELGMKVFVKSENFKKLNVGFSMDEGMATRDDSFVIFYAERSIWQINFKISGRSGHGSAMVRNTPGEKLSYIVNKINELRERELERLEQNPNLNSSDVASINLTVISGGVQKNVIPPLFEVCFDMRLALEVDHEAFEKQLLDWCEEAGGGITLEFLQKGDKIRATSMTNSNPYWLSLKKIFEELSPKVRIIICPGGTDSRYLRQVGVGAIGFSPMCYTQPLAHAHNEYLSSETYLKGIEIYKKLIQAVANT